MLHSAAPELCEKFITFSTCTHASFDLIKVRVFDRDKIEIQSSWTYVNTEISLSQRYFHWKIRTLTEEDILRHEELLSRHGKFSSCSKRIYSWKKISFFNQFSKIEGNPYKNLGPSACYLAWYRVRSHATAPEWFFVEKKDILSFYPVLMSPNIHYNVNVQCPRYVMLLSFACSRIMPKLGY